MWFLEDLVTALVSGFIDLVWDFDRNWPRVLFVVLTIAVALSLVFVGLRFLE